MSVKDYASKEGHSKVVNQLSMQKMSVMARTRSQENVLDDLDQVDSTQIEKNNKNSNNHSIIEAQITKVDEEVKLKKSNNEDSQNTKKIIASNSSIENDNELRNLEGNQNEKKHVTSNESISDVNKLEINKNNSKDAHDKTENMNLDSKLTSVNELPIEKLSIEKNYNNENMITSSVPINENKINDSSIEPNKELIEKIELNIIEEKNVIQVKDEESVSQCTMPPPMNPSKSWDFIQTSIMQTADINEKSEKEAQENIEQIPDPIVCAVNTDDSELEWGSDESLPTDPNQTCPVVGDEKNEGQKVNSFFNFISTKLIKPNKKKAFASADSIIDGAPTNKHVRNKSCTPLSTFKLTVPSDVNKALDQLSPEMNFTHSSFSKSKSFNEHIPIENIDKNTLEFERSKSLCLELKQNFETSENQQRDSDSQSDDSSLRSKRSLLLSMRMPKVHDEHHDDYHLDIKDSETSEDEGPHYWYSPNKKNDKIVQQDTVIRNNSESEDSE